MNGGYAWYRTTFNDGQLQSTATFAETGEALGSTILGAARRQVQRVDVFNGDVRSAQLYNGVLDEGERGQPGASGHQASSDKPALCAASLTTVSST